jgi:hypothetical protein
VASAVIFIRQNDSRTQLIVFFGQAFNRFLIVEEILLMEMFQLEFLYI